MAPPENDDPRALHFVLQERKQLLLDRWIEGTRLENTADPVSRGELLDHIPRFIDELIAALHPAALPLPLPTTNANEHGAQRFRLGFNVAEIVREYGTLHRCIVEIATDEDCPITPRDHAIISRWLNDGLASAISQYVSDRDAEIQRQGAEHLGFIAHEIRNPLSSANMAFRLLQRGALAGGGRPVELLERNLQRVVDVVDNALQHAALNMGVEVRAERIELLAFLRSIELDSSANAEAKGIQVTVSAPAALTVHADARLLNSAISNLVRNAVKFSRPDSTIEVRALLREGQVLVEVEDSCGGLPPGRAEELFTPLVQRGKDQSGFGLGLAIAMQAARAHNGSLAVRDCPGSGCIFVLQLPALKG